MVTHCAITKQFYHIYYPDKTNPVVRESHSTSNKTTYFYGIQITSLIYLSRLYDNDRIAVLDKNEIKMIKGSKLIFKGLWNGLYRLRGVLISNPIRHRAHAIITTDKKD